MTAVQRKTALPCGMRAGPERRGTSSREPVQLHLVGGGRARGPSAVIRWITDRAPERTRGVSVEALAREALERAVDYDDWFLREVEEGLAQVEDGQTLTHEAVGTRIARKLADDDAR